MSLLRYQPRNIQTTDYDAVRLATANAAEAEYEVSALAFTKPRLTSRPALASPICSSRAGPVPLRAGPPGTAPLPCPSGAVPPIPPNVRWGNGPSASMWSVSAPIFGCQTSTSRPRWRAPKHCERTARATGILPTHGYQSSAFPGSTRRASSAYWAATDRSVMPVVRVTLLIVGFGTAAGRVGHSFYEGVRRFAELLPFFRFC